MGQSSPIQRPIAQPRPRWWQWNDGEWGALCRYYDGDAGLGQDMVMYKRQYRGCFGSNGAAAIVFGAACDRINKLITHTHQDPYESPALAFHTRRTHVLYSYPSICKAIGHLQDQACPITCELTGILGIGPESGFHSAKRCDTIQSSI